ncbi:MAG: hypothetical protein RPR97_13055, partial [Colwellia sp.]
MSQVKEAITNRRLLFSHIIIFATVILATLVVSIHLVVKQHVISTLESNTNAWATSVAQTSSVYLQQKNSDSHEQLQEKLKQIITAPFINYIQIYKQNAIDK